MNSLQTYPIHSQATAGLHGADLFVGVGKPEGSFGVLAINPQSNDNLIKEASR
jgi:hypothetical protein